MGDRPGSSARGRMSEDKVRRKDWCWSVRVVYVLGKLSDVSGPSLREVGRYTMPQGQIHHVVAESLKFSQSEQGQIHHVVAESLKFSQSEHWSYLWERTLLQRQ